jgi:hypothetical protein
MSTYHPPSVISASSQVRFSDVGLRCRRLRPPALRRRCSAAASLTAPFSPHPYATQGRARHLVAIGAVSSGFWVHGLWPARLAGPMPEYCTTEAFDAAQLGPPFEAALAFYLRSPTTTRDPTVLRSFWSHEWARCAGLARRAGGAQRTGRQCALGWRGAVRAA